MLLRSHCRNRLPQASWRVVCLWALAFALRLRGKRKGAHTVTALALPPPPFATSFFTAVVLLQLLSVLPQLAQPLLALVRLQLLHKLLLLLLYVEATAAEDFALPGSTQDRNYPQFKSAPPSSEVLLTYG